MARDCSSPCLWDLVSQLEVWSAWKACTSVTAGQSRAGINPCSGYPEVTRGLLFLLHFECQISTSIPRQQLEYPHLPHSPSTVLHGFPELRSPAILSYCLCVNELVSVYDQHTEFVMICLFALQLLDLFMVWDWSTYLADYGQPTSKYLRVNPSTALALLEKWVFFSCNLHLITYGYLSVQFILRHVAEASV